VEESKSEKKALVNMSAVSAWLRRRLDSTGSSEGAGGQVGGDEIGDSSSRKNSINYVRKSVRRQTEPPSVTYESETGLKGGRRSRHLSIGDPNASNLPPATKEESGSTYVKVKAQWQRAVRKISVSSGYNSGGSSASSSLMGNGGPGGGSSPTGQINRVRRTSMDKPSWGARTGTQACDYYHILPPQPRTRHLSLSNNPPGPYYYYSQSPPRVVHDEVSVTKTLPGSKIPVSLLVSQSPPPPVIATLSMVLESKPSPVRKSSSPDEECDGEEDDGYDNCDSMSNLPYAVGKATPFPDGSEAVMIDSALAHNAFQEQVRLIRCYLHSDIAQKDDYHDSSSSLKARLVDNFLNEIFTFHFDSQKTSINSY